MFDHLEYGRGMDDHKVDVHACCGVTASRRSLGRLSQGAYGVESCRGDSDDSHTVIHLDFAVDIRITVHRVTGDVLLEVCIDVRVNEQDSALIGDFSVVKGCFCGLNKICDVVAAGQGCGHGRACACGILCESVQLCYRVGFLSFTSHTFV